MRFWMVAAASAAAFLATGPAVAGKKDEPKADGDKMVCHVETLSGSRIANRKTCHTKDEWAQIERERHHDADDAKENTYNRGLTQVADRPN